MSYKTILACLNDIDRIDQVAGLAAQLAARFDAHLTGLFVGPGMPIYPEPAAFILPEMIDAHEAYFKERADRARKAFDDIVAKNGLRGEYREVKAVSPMIAPTVIEHGRMADLVVIGQLDHDNPKGHELDFVDQVVMEAGRPVLVVPYAGRFKTIGARVVVGWNGTREAARAVFDAVPLLRQASEVWLCWADPQKQADQAGDLPGAEIATALARQDVKATAYALPSGDIKTGDALLNCAADRDADLIVIGAYGHSRMREYIFGGVTQAFIDHMTVPVLMSN